MNAGSIADRGWSCWRRLSTTVAHGFVVFFWLTIVGIAATACTAGSSSEPAKQGTPTNPVAQCTRLADVCQVGSSSQLGVCTQPAKAKQAALCGTREPCLVCAPQH